ncbi:MAG: tol-pal system YbgF family protein [Phycisphaerae bacterium]
MKGTRRKELRSNELIESLRQLVAFGRRHSNYVVAGAVGAALVVGLGAYWQRAKAGRLQQGWSELLLVAQREGSGSDRLARLRQVAEGYEAAPLAAVAWQLLGDALFDQATYGVAGEQAGRREELLDQASRAYQRILARYRQQWIARAVALIGLAKIAENRHDWLEARRYYQAVLDEPQFDATPYHSLAREALARLDRLAEPVELVAVGATTQAVSSGPATSQAAAASEPSDRLSSER